MIPRRWLYALFAAALFLSGLAWRTAAKQESDSAEQSKHATDLENTIKGLTTSNLSISNLVKDQGKQIADVADQNSSLLKDVSRIANAANIDPDQSAQDLADKVINRINQFQEALAATNSHVQSLEHPPPDPDALYQSEQKVAKFETGRIYADNKHFEFIKIYDAGSINFSNEILFRGLVLKCAPHMIDIMIGSGPRGAETNIMNNVICDIISGQLINPPSRSPSAP